MSRVGTVDPVPSKQIGFVRAGVHAVVAVEHFADFDTTPKQFFARRLYVGDDEIQALR